MAEEKMPNSDNAKKTNTASLEIDKIIKKEGCAAFLTALGTKFFKYDDLPKHESGEAIPVFRMGKNTIVSKKVNFPTGESDNFFILKNPPGIVAVPLLLTDEKLHVVLIKQFRAGAGRYLWEVPGGVVDKNEKLESTAVREVEEETGYEVTRVKRLGAIHEAAPGYMEEPQVPYIAFLSGRRVKFEADDTDKIVEIKIMSIGDAIKLVLSESEGLSPVDLKTKACILHVASMIDELEKDFKNQKEINRHRKEL